MNTQLSEALTHQGSIDHNIADFGTIQADGYGVLLIRILQEIIEVESVN